MRKKNGGSAVFILAALGLFGCASDTGVPVVSPDEVAVGGRSTLQIVDPSGQGAPQVVAPYKEVFDVEYRGGGSRLALAECFQQRVVELDTSGYSQLLVAFQGNGCPRHLAYEPAGAFLAATIPVRPDPLSGQWFTHLRGNATPLQDVIVAGPILQPASPALAFRPGGQELAVATQQGLEIRGTGAGFPLVATLAGTHASSLAYTTEGDRLIVGTATGFSVLNAANGYATLTSETSGPVRRVAVAAAGNWIALLTSGAVSIRRAPDLHEVQVITPQTTFVDLDWSPDGTTLAIAEPDQGIRLFGAPTWAEATPLTVQDTINAIAYRPDPAPRIPVLFVHGHSGDSGEAWLERASGTSFAAALAANPSLRIDAFYLELPVHGGGQNLARSIVQDAEEIRAAIEGGADSQGHQRVGILNLPRYQGVDRVAIVAYSQGTLSSRYYIKNLMGGPSVTVSEFVTLAAPNHGVGGVFSCGDANEPDRARRQLCGGRRATLLSVAAPCGQCGITPSLFTTNQPGDDTFITDLNGHAFAESCDPGFSQLAEAPRSRPTESGGVLYVNVYAANNADILVGGDQQANDCLGRRLAQNHAPDASNIEVPISGVSTVQVHPHFPHDWTTICVALKALSTHQAPASATACAGLTRP